MKLFLDDVRQPPSENWTLVKTTADCIRLLTFDNVTDLSLDHDLGEEPGVGCGYDVLIWLENQVALHGFKPPEFITVHSSNAGARPKMLAAIESIRRLARSGK